MAGMHGEKKRENGLPEPYRAGETESRVIAPKFLPVLAVFLNAFLTGCTGFESDPGSPGSIPREACVVLLHGLARTSTSMENMEAALVHKGYYVVNVDYPSRRHKVEKLAAQVIPNAVKRCPLQRREKIHFVTHSMGGILVRYYLAHNELTELGRVVMLSPPNQGSEVVDKLKNFPGFRWINGPAGEQLGTDEKGIPSQLPPVDYEVGVITGDRTINFINSFLIPGKDDGKVSVKRAKVGGMTDFLVTHHTHPFIMKARDVIRQVATFLELGRFEHEKE